MTSVQSHPEDSQTFFTLKEYVMKRHFSGIMLSLALLSSCAVSAATIEETNHILFANFAPDDVRTATIVPAVVGVVVAAACTLGKEKAVSAPYLGAGIQWVAGAMQVDGKDLIEGLGLFVAINGGLGLWQKGPEFRDDFAKGTGLMLAKQYFFNPNKVEAHEVRSAIIQGGLAGILGLPFFKDNLPKILGMVLPERFKKQ